MLYGTSEWGKSTVAWSGQKNVSELSREGQDLSRYVLGSVLGSWNTVGTREYDCSH